MTPTPAAPAALDAALLRRWIRLAEHTAGTTRGLVDSLNVFPVPDSDTGSNVWLTLRWAADALDLLPARADLSQTARAVADGAVRGARGNAGLLVSQALAAVADVAAEAPDPARLRPVELVHVYERMAATTWAAVSRPVTATLLTVAHDAAASARSSLEEATPARPATISLIASSAALGAQESVVETAGLGHGPVDAGGAALMLLLTSLTDAVESAGTRDPALGGDVSALPATYTEVARQMLVDLASGGVTHAGEDRLAPEDASQGEFEVMYLLEATAAQARELRTRLEAIGDSVGVVGTPDALGVGLFQVHVHTDTPRAALPAVGRARQVCVHHLHPTALVVATGWEADEPPLPWGASEDADDGRVVSFERLAARREQRRAAERESSRRVHPSQRGARPHPTAARRGTGVIACTRAPGLLEQLARTGAVVVLDPEREGIVRAAGDLGLPEALVLPCDAASTSQAHEAARFLAARSAVSTVRGPGGARSTDDAHQAGHATAGTRLLVADTDDEARVLASAVAVAGHGEHEDLAALSRRAWDAAAVLRTTALTGPASDPDAAARAVTEILRPEDELLTVILGRDALPDVGALVCDAAARFGEEILGDADAVEVVLHAGGQGDPDVLIAVE